MNMKNMTLIAIMAFSFIGFSQESVKIGVVNGDYVIQNSIKGKRFFEKFKGFNEKKTDNIKAKMEIFKQKEQDFQAKSS